MGTMDSRECRASRWSWFVAAYSRLPGRHSMATLASCLRSLPQLFAASLYCSDFARDLLRADDW